MVAVVLGRAVIALQKLTTERRRATRLDGVKRAHLGAA
jgi:hypothetical protein